MKTSFKKSNFSFKSTECVSSLTQVKTCLATTPLLTSSSEVIFCEKILEKSSSPSSSLV